MSNFISNLSVIWINYTKCICIYIGSVESSDAISPYTCVLNGKQVLCTERLASTVYSTVSKFCKDPDPVVLIGSEFRKGPEHPDSNSLKSLSILSTCIDPSLKNDQIYIYCYIKERSLVRSDPGWIFNGAVSMRHYNRL